MFHRVAVKKGSVANSCRAELGELRERRRRRDLEYVHRSSCARDEVPQRLALAQEDREDAVGAGVQVGLRSERIVPALERSRWARRSVGGL